MQAPQFRWSKCPWCEVPADLSLPCPSCARLSPSDSGQPPIFDAMGRRRAPLTIAQIANVTWPTPSLYERVWRRRSLSLLSGRPFPIAEELAELQAAVSVVFDPTAALSASSSRGLAVDIGCSEGLYTRHLASHGWQVVAVDHSRGFLVRARQRIVNEQVDPTRVTLVRAVAQQLPIVSGSVDAVAIGGSLNEIGDASAAMAEVARVLRPGGVLFSMHLVAAQQRLGRSMQTAARAAGIRPYDQIATETLLGDGFVTRSWSVDGVVARLVAVRR